MIGAQGDAAILRAEEVAERLGTINYEVDLRDLGPGHAPSASRREPGVRPPLRALADLAGEQAWVVGGAVRDELLGRPTTDVDVAVEGNPRGARPRARPAASDAHRFELSEAFGAWRVVARDHSWQLDLLPLEGESIEADLAAPRPHDQRDRPARSPAASSSIPPAGPRTWQSGVLRIVAPDAFLRDPLRALRVVRFARRARVRPRAGDARGGLGGRRRAC